MTRFLLGTRYLILIPVLGLAISAAFFFAAGGIGLILLIAEYLGSLLSTATQGAEIHHNEVIVHVVEYVHTFLVGTVLYITGIGLFQLFIKPVEFHGWLKIENTEELETNLIGVTVVVLAVNFMGAAFTSETENLLQYGTGIALPIAALGLFVGLRSWSAYLTKKAHNQEDDDSDASSEVGPPH